MIQSLKRNINITVNGLRVSYNEEGPVDKPVVIFIHGYPLNKSIWDFQLETLHDFYRVIAYDLRGQGNSEAGSEDYSMTLFADDLIRFMDELKIAKAIVCGHAMGGYILLNAVERYPERFEGLVLCDTQSKSDNSEARELKTRAIENIQINGVDDYSEELVKNLFAYLSFTSKREEIAAVKDVIKKSKPENLINMLNAMMDRKDSTNSLSDIKVPVLIMVGKRDMITSVAKSEFLHENIEGSMLELINYAGHLPNLENSWEFNRCLKKFLDTTSSHHKQPYFDKPDKDRHVSNLTEIGSKLLFQIQRLISPAKLT